MQEQTNEVTVPAPAERAALALGSSKTEASLIEMAAKAAAITNVVDVAGRQEAHQAGMTLRGARTTITKTGKAARDDANAFCSAVITEEKRLIKIVQPEEDRVLGLRDAFDAKVAAEKAEVDRIERERIAAIKAKIEAIRNIPMGMVDETSIEIGNEKTALEQFGVGTEFAEFADDARSVVLQAIVALNDLYHTVKAREDEAARQVALAEANRIAAIEIERQRAELAAQQAEAARVATQQEAERQRVAAETKRQLDEQQAKIAAEAKAAADQQAAERAAFEAEKQAFAAEQARIAAEKQDLIDAEACRVAYLEEAERVAALPVEQVAEILADEPLAEVVDMVQPAAAEPAETIDDLQEVADFRLAARALLITRTAEEVMAVLSDEIERFMSLKAAA